MQEKANALLMSEETMTFYMYNLKIKPDDEIIRFAISYLMKILNILLKFNQAYYKDMSKLIKKTISNLLSNS